MSEEQKEKDPLEIINDPKHRVSAEKHFGGSFSGDEDDKEDPQTGTQGGLSRRNFLLYGGAAAVGASVVSSAVTGFQTGRSADAYTGYGRTYQGDDMFFDREPFRVDVPAMMTPVGEVTRPNWTDLLFERRGAVAELIKKKLWNPTMGLEKMPGVIGDYYREHPERYDSIIDQFERTDKRLRYWDEVAHKQYAIAGAYTKAFNLSMYGDAGSNVPPDPADVYNRTGIPQPPEEWDFRNIPRDKDGNIKHKMEFKSPGHASKLIKRMAHLFGMSVVAITPFDKRFMFTNYMRGMPDKGHNTGLSDYPGWGDKVPEHWKSLIVFGVPMYWDSNYAAIGYATSFDAYFRARNAAGNMENFIQCLGHPARAQFPGNHYEIMMAPYMLLSGLAEYARAGLVMVPELGANVRPAAVVTDIEFEYDKPIGIGMANFCKKCKICAETCPSGAITFDDEPQTVVRGFKRWLLDEEKCYTQWASGPIIDGLGCRVCVAVCPYSRKNTWIHTISRELEARDKSGTVGTLLLAMQQNFFKYPTGEEFRATWDGGTEALYHDPPWWERAEDFFSNVEKTWEYHGMY